MRIYHPSVRYFLMRVMSIIYFQNFRQEKKLFIQPDEFERKEEILADKEAAHAVVFGKSENVIEDFCLLILQFPYTL